MPVLEFPSPHTIENNETDLHWEEDTDWRVNWAPSRPSFGMTNACGRERCRGSATYPWHSTEFIWSLEQILHAYNSTSVRHSSYHQEWVFILPNTCLKKTCVHFERSYKNCLSQAIILCTKKTPFSAFNFQSQRDRNVHFAQMNVREDCLIGSLRSCETILFLSRNNHIANSLFFPFHCTVSKFPPSTETKFRTESININ